MSIVTFWGSGKEQVGKTLAVVAIATNMAIEHNKKILVISASYSNNTLKNCYWSEENAKKTSIFRAKTGVELDSGMEGIAKIIQSNKVSPEIITNYTKIVFKDRLEVLLGFEDKTLSSPEEVARIYSELVKIAGRYYDIVLVDLDNEIDETWANEILKKSDLVIAMAPQKVASIKDMQEKREQFAPGKSMLLIGRYDQKSKYTIKNLTRMLGEKKDLLTIPYNTLYFEAAQEGNVADMFLKLRRIEDKTDENAFFIEQVKSATQEVMKKISEDNLLR